MNIPTLLTLLRISAVPVLAIVYYLPFPWAHPAASIVFIVAALTDWLDGYLARSLSQTTELGAFLDPVADKILIAFALILVLGENVLPYMAIPIAIIVSREIVISALREWMAEIGKRASVAVSFLGKIKTAAQMGSLILLLWFHSGSAAWIAWIAMILLYIAVALTLWSMVIYIKLAWPDLTLSKER